MCVQSIEKNYYCHDFGLEHAYIFNEESANLTGGEFKREMLIPGSKEHLLCFNCVKIVRVSNPTDRPLQVQNCIFI